MGRTACTRVHFTFTFNVHLVGIYVLKYEAHLLLARRSIETRSNACYLLIEKYLTFEGKIALDSKITISLLFHFLNFILMQLMINHPGIESR